MAEQRDVRAEAREKAIDEVVRRTHSLLLHASGTAGAPTLERVREAVLLCIQAAQDPDYADVEYFQGPGFIMRINRKGSPWPTFETFVAATTAGYFLIGED